MKVFDLNQDLRGKRVVLRASLNVPVASGRVANTFRIERALPTIEALAAAGARTTVIAHIGREKTASLAPVYEELTRRSARRIRFAGDVLGNTARQAVAALEDGEVLLLENVRRAQGEIENDDTAAKALAAYGDVYLNDAFADSHRAHASIVGIPRHIPGFAGPNFMREYEGILPACSPESPSLGIVGGAKFGTKEPLLRHIVSTYDRVFIGGALAHDFFLAKGFEIGKSLTSRSGDVTDLLKNSKLVLPKDVVVSGADGVETKAPADVLPVDTILDVGHASLSTLAPHIEKARLILWNGPLGNFEQGFSAATEALAKKVASAAGRSVVGGGDTIAAIQNLRLMDKFTHVSTAGGAMLQFITDGTLPGIKALSEVHNTAAVFGGAPGR